MEMNRQGYGCGGCISFILLVGGGIMYGVCKDASIDGSCGGKTEIADAGLIMLFIGAGLMGLTILCCCCCCLIALYLFQTENELEFKDFKPSYTISRI